MGMFDYISVADKLPTNAEIDAAGLNLYSEAFQTKDLDNIMATYYIQGGRLFVEKYKVTEWVEDPEGFAGGYLDRKEPYQEEVHDYHGKLRFYHLIDKDDKDHWIEYEAFFTHGKVEKMELVKYEANSNVERKKNLEELFDRMKEERNKWYNKYFFQTEPCIKIRQLLRRFLYWIERRIQDLRMYI